MVQFNSIKKHLLLLARFCTGLLFTYSGFSKLIQPPEYFQISIGFFDVFPDPFIPYIANVIPWIEYIFGSFLLIGFWIEGSAVILAFLTGGFQIVLAQALLRKLSIDECGCFGGGYIHLTLYQSFLLDTLLILIFIQLAQHQIKPLRIDRFFSHQNIP